jgi:hypothetical protein
MKNLKISLSVTLAALLLTACGSVSNSEGPALTTITLGGVGAVEVEFEAPFNVMTGVTATGDNNQDYTNLITFASISPALNKDTGVLDTTKPGLLVVQYNVTVGSIVARQFRNITVLQPEAVVGEMLQNGDFSLGTAVWNAPANGYLDLYGGRFNTFEVINGELRIDVVASGTNPVFPRFGQMNIPFLQGKTYEISFDARSSVSRIISMQMGRLLPAAPWFDDFLEQFPMAERFFRPTLTTSMATYTYTFTMNKNDIEGGILFGFGTVAGDQPVNAVIHIDNIEIVEVSA